jgi:hypothetical protein
MSDLHQQLWEFCYDLLPEAEAEALRQRISSDPQVARAFATVKLQTEMVERAARVDADAAIWRRPDRGGKPADAPRLARGELGTNRSRIASAANWVVSVAAIGLVCIMGIGYLLPSSPDAQPAVVQSATPPPAIRTVFTGPSKLHLEATNYFSVRTTDSQGLPVETNVAYRIYDNAGNLALSEERDTDLRGNVRFELSGSLAKDAARVEVGAVDQFASSLSRELEVSESKFVTYLRLDRPLFRPGERVSFRSVTLSRFGLRAPSEETEVEFEIIAVDGQPLENSRSVVETQQGVGSGKFQLPNDLTDGTYSLVARSASRLFPEEWRDFKVQSFRAPRLKKTLELVRESYTSGDEVEAEFMVEAAAGGALANAPLKIQAIVDDEPLTVPPATTDDKGAYKVRFALPETMERGKASLSVTVADGESEPETITKPIAINLGKVNVDFYPEGGELIAGLPSRVYFHSRDPLGKPVHLIGRILDEEDREVASVATAHEGRGVFEMQPVSDRRYRLAIDTPAGVDKQVTLPPASSDGFMVLDTGTGVFDGASPIDLTIHSIRPATPLVIAAYCRGAMVGQLALDQSDYLTRGPGIASFQGELPLAEDAQGVIRITAYDQSSEPIRPVAERLVYRQITKKVHVEVAGDRAWYAPTDPVELKLRITDETEAPLAAALGIAVVDDAVLNLADDKSTRMPTYFHLLTEIDYPEDLEDANFYLSEEEGAAEALDLLLGTQGWRRFVEVPRDQFAKAGAGLGGGGFGLADELADRQVADHWSFGGAAVVTAEPFVPFVVENTGSLPVKQSKSITVHSDSRPPKRLLGGVLVAGSVVVLVWLVMTGLLRIHNSWRVWVPATTVAGVSLAVGLIWSSARVASQGDVALSPMVPASAAVDSAASFAEAESIAAGGEDSVRQPKAAIGIAEGAQASTPEPAEEAPAPFAQPADDAPVAENVAPAPAATAMKRAAPLPSEPAAESEDEQKQVPAPSLQMQPAPSQDYRDKIDQLLLRQRKMRSVESGKELAATDLYARLYAFDAAKNKKDNEANASSSTLFWHPLLITDRSGEASIYFTLPGEATSYRAIIEAHGADRLGAGETIIIPRPPE